MLLEIGIMQPKLQIVGGTGLLDCEGLTMKHVRQFSPSVALQGMNVMGVRNINTNVYVPLLAVASILSDLITTPSIQYSSYYTVI